MKRITKPEQLPEWFNIEDYLQEPESYYEAVRSIDARHAVVFMFKSGMTDYLKDEGLEHELEKRLNELFSSKDKYRCRNIYMDTMLKTWEKNASQEMLEEAERDIHDKDNRAEIEDEIKRRAKNILTAHESDLRDEIIGEISLLHVLIWIEENQELINELKAEAKTISEQYGVNYDDAKSFMLDHASLKGGIGASTGNSIFEDQNCCVEVTTYPNPLAQLEALKKRFSAYIHPPGGSELDKTLFKYRVAAYLDLTLWALLEGKKITKACMARALFPLPDDALYSGNHMDANKTPGKFYHRVLHDKYWMDSLEASAYARDKLNKK